MDDQKKVALSEEEISRYPENVQEALRQGLPLNIIYRNLATQYSRIKPPDKDMLAEYVVRAKGPERSMRQFAEEIGVNASTLSRIVNKKTVRANSDNLIADIAAYADKNSGITFEMLMRAHGMDLSRDIRNRWAHNADIETVYDDLIIKALLNRGYSVARLEPERHRTISGGFSFDLVLKTDAIPRGDGIWGFDFCMVQPASFEAPREHLSQMKSITVMRHFSRIAGLFADYQYRYDRVSIVLTDSDAFYGVQKRLEDCYLRCEVTIILIDLETGDVADEFMIPWIDETKCEIVFTPLPEPEEKESDDDDLWDDDFDDPE